MAIGEATGKLALLGGPKAVPEPDPELFRWPIVTDEDEQAVLAVLRAGAMSNDDVSKQFEADYAAYQGLPYALSFCNGTAALLAAMYGCGVRRGDEIICPSLTYWASALPAFALGATVVFADIEPDSICIDPKDIAHRITPRTKAIVVVHYCGHPADMDPIMAIAGEHDLKVIEDVSHAHGALYRGRLVGSIGDVSAMSMMSGKSLPVGEAGMLCTASREIWEYAVALGHYERTKADITLPALQEFSGLPLGGYKHRINQTCSAMGRVQLRHYPARIAEIQQAMNHFWDGLEGLPGVRPHRPAKDSGSTMGGWYNPLGHYRPEELGGLPVDRFLQVLNAEGLSVWRGANLALHLHPVFNSADIYGDGKPTRIAFSDRDLRQAKGSLPVSEALAERCMGIPWFKHYRPEQIDSYIAAYRKVVGQAEALR
jgi:perosamine synthetase